MARSGKPAYRVAVYGPAAEYDEVVPSQSDLECLFLKPATDGGRLDPIPAFVVLDLDYVGGDVERVLPTLNALDPHPTIVAVTRDPSADDAVRVLTGGAKDYCVLPRDRDKLVAAIEAGRRAWRRVQVPTNGRGHENPVTLPGFPDIIARCEPMQTVLGVVRKIIDSGARTVLIRGETGTGKELVARAIHYQSARGDQPFIEVNCTAIPETLLEAELFGYEAGAFTDAKTSKKGLLQLADQGTLFLDELGDMSLNLQGKLLRAIEEKRFRRLGGTAEIAVSMRIIAATSKNLEQAIAQGLFRSDLYYRLNVVSVEVPPLRERGPDVVILAEHFAARYSEQYGKALRPISDEARSFLRTYAWPGNVRELKNTIERAVLLSEGPVIELSDVAPAVGRRRKQVDEFDHFVIDLPPEGFPFEEYERRIIAHALKRNRWNRSHAARELGISRPRLLRKIEKYRLAQSSA
jgi:two-component system, NtrC family, response regulator AtoC